MTKTNRHAHKVGIDASLVGHLVATQFPQWANLPIKPVDSSGWDNRTFHLGEHMIVRLPSAACYAAQVEKEHEWLPRLAPLLPLPIPLPLAMGVPADLYPWPWSVYRWIEGDTATGDSGLAAICDRARPISRRPAADRLRRWPAAWAAQLFSRGAADSL